MSEVERITDQLRLSLEGEAWHGPSLGELLDGIDARQALVRPLPEAHSIWEITLHIAVWERVARRMIDGEFVGDLPPQDDWPSVTDTSPAAWAEACRELVVATQELRLATLTLGDERLDESVSGQPYTYYNLVHGVVQHNLYHAGQIALLGKGAAARE